MTISELCERHPRLALDSNVLIYVLERAEPRAGIGRALLDALEARRTQGVISTIGLAELTVGPVRHGAPADVERYVDELRSIDGLEWRPVTADIAVDAGILRGARGIGLPDAIHLASARASAATAFITNDRRLRGSAHLEVIYLDDLELDEPAA